MIVAAARSDPRRIAQGLNVVKVSVADVRVELNGKLRYSTKWDTSLTEARAMKRRVALWAIGGLLVGCVWNVTATNPTTM
jgi:hypothetical protein